MDLVDVRQRLHRLALRAARARFWSPMLVVLALLAMAVNETTYQHARNTLTRGIDLTDTRLAAASTLQLLTDAESSARKYVVGGHREDLAAYRAVLAALPQAQASVLDLVAKVDPEGLVSVAEVQSLTQARLNTLESWVTARNTDPAAVPAQASGATPAARTTSDDSRAQHGALRAAFDQLLQQAAGVQHTARTSLYDAMMLSRVAVHGLVLLLLLALLLWSRLLKQRDALQAADRLSLAHQVNERTAQLRQLADHLVNAREDERGRVARELHDDMGGLLTAMKLELARLRRVPSLPAAALDRVAGVERRLNDGIALKRRIIENLRPSSLDQLGLCSALEMLCTDVSSNLGVPVHATLHPVALNKEAELTVYRVVQESLTNISKYARAKAVRVSLEAVGNQVRVTVKDDGQGFDVLQVASGHHGLLGMRVRVEAHSGSLTVRSAPGQGCEISAQLPSSVQGQNEAERGAS